jgi:hypothetical protein
LEWAEPASALQTGSDAKFIIDLLVGGTLLAAINATPKMLTAWRKPTITRSQAFSQLVSKFWHALCLLSGH